MPDAKPAMRGRNAKWTVEMTDMLMFMRYIEMSHTECADNLNREFGTCITGSACIGHYNRMLKNGIDYVYNAADFPDEKE